jgi:hypothetical protein
LNLTGVSQGLFHEIHNEREPAPAEQASRIATWIRAHTITASTTAAITVAGGHSSLGEEQSMMTMGTEGGDRVITAEVDRAARKVAKSREDDGYANKSAAAGLEENKSKL